MKKKENEKRKKNENEKKKKIKKKENEKKDKKKHPKKRTGTQLPVGHSRTLPLLRGHVISGENTQKRAGTPTSGCACAHPRNPFGVTLPVRAASGDVNSDQGGFR